MRSVHIGGRRLLAVSAAFAAAALVLAGCSGSNNSSSGSSGGTLTIGTTDKITSIDPAGSYDNGSFAVMNQVYPFLMNSPYGSPDVKPDIAESAAFTSPTEYTVKLKPNLKFANGHSLTSEDVKFTFDRQLKINDPNGPASLLGNLDGVSTPDKTTAVFKLKVPNDQTFAQVLSSPAGPIVDHQVFSADKVTPDNTIVKGHPFAGQYDITSYDFNNLIAYKALKLDIQKGAIDVAFRSLSATDVESLGTDKNVKVVKGPGGELRYIVWNFNTQPYGATTPEADAKKALAVRQAAADLVDRATIAKQVYKDTYTPVYSFVPQGLTGATTVLKDLYGDGNGGPSLDKAKAVLQAAGVTTPIALNLQYNPDHYGPSSGDEYALVKEQLENGGLFKVFPDYSDADNYLSPFFSKDNFLANHYDNPEVQQLITQQLGSRRRWGRTCPPCRCCRAPRSPWWARTSRAPTRRSTRRSSSATRLSRRARPNLTAERGRLASAGRPHLRTTHDWLP